MKSNQTKISIKVIRLLFMLIISQIQLQAFSVNTKPVIIIGSSIVGAIIGKTKIGSNIARLLSNKLVNSKIRMLGGAFLFGGISNFAIDLVRKNKVKETVSLPHELPEQQKNYNR